MARAPRRIRRHRNASDDTRGFGYRRSPPITWRCGIALLENSTTTAFGLAVLILLFGPVSGAHLNPVVTVADWLARRHANSRIGGGRVVAYTVSQAVGGIVGAMLANVMFDRAVLEISTKDRFSTGHLVGEVSVRS